MEDIVVTENPDSLMQSALNRVPLQELDRRYFSFASRLPEPLNTLACDQQLFRGKGESQPFKSLQDAHPLTVCLPWLFREAFPAVSEPEFLAISEASTFLIMGLLLNDPYLDGQLPHHSGLPLLHQQLNKAALRKFHHLFEAQSPFWSYFDHYTDQYTTALLKEMEYQGNVAAYPKDLMYEIGSGKIALFKAAPTALAVKAKAEELIPKLEEAVDLLGVAMQLCDDIEDWAEDYQRKNYTLPLTLSVPVEQWPNPNLSVEEVGRQLEDSFILERLIAQVIAWFRQALDTVAEIPCPGWVEFVENYLKRAERYQRSLVAKKLLKIMDSI
jgi:hypothetical protein